MSTLVVIALDGDGGMGRATLVTPIGLHELQATAEPNRYRVELTSGRPVEMVLH